MQSYWRMGIKKLFLVSGFLFLVAAAYSQHISQRLQKAYQRFETDSQLKHAISSLYVIDAATGQVVFDKNSQVGLAPASTQKIITSVTAFELLGKSFKYKTYFTKEHWNATDHLVVYASGDPTFGSGRFNSTKEQTIFDELVKKISESYIDDIYIKIIGDSRQIPSGWIFEDIGNYYGAGSFDLNWRENQYDITFVPGKAVGDPAEIIRDTNHKLPLKRIKNECKTGPPGSGDNAYVYFIPNSTEVLIQGTIPAGVKEFTISGAIPDPEMNFAFSFMDFAISKGISFNAKQVGKRLRDKLMEPHDVAQAAFYTHSSPSLDSIIYWFNKKSINLYGEALIKTFAYEKQGFGSTDSGVNIVKKFWKEKGLDEDELNIYDGSGLSPLNRVTTHAQVEILKYAKTKDWFPYFLRSLPEYNGMTIKSGTISDVKGFCGYHKAKDGKEYIFSFLVNNYSGRSSMLVNKMYKVLDELK
jgi:serine-type D-Ala-D-Ala carboxypeptidase/endopeptidase (penicillin-binding protein 4)